MSASGPQREGESNGPSHSYPPACGSLALQTDRRLAVSLSPVTVVVMPGSGVPHRPRPQLWGPAAIFLLALQR